MSAKNYHTTLPKNLRCNSRIKEAINDTQKVKLNSRSSFCHEYSERGSWEAETMSGTYLWTECGYRHAASWRFFIFTVPFTKLKINSLVLPFTRYKLSLLLCETGDRSVRVRSQTTLARRHQESAAPTRRSRRGLTRFSLLHAV